VVVAIIAGVGTSVAFPSTSHACIVAALIQRSLFPQPPAGNFQVLAKVEIIELTGHVYRRGASKEIESAYSAKAKVIEARDGVSENEVIHLRTSGSSCDIPFQVGQTGFIASNEITRADGILSARIHAVRIGD
jgi:hypothetical protein